MEKVANSENSRSFIEMDDEEDLRDEEGEDVDDSSSQAEEGSSTSSPSSSRESAAQLACSATMMHRASHGQYLYFCTRQLIPDDASRIPSPRLASTKVLDMHALNTHDIQCICISQYTC
jgi:hypothetical protein